MRCVRALVEREGFVVSRVRALNPGDGGANRVWTVDVDDTPWEIIVKMRVDVDDAALGEAWALRRLDGTDAPRLIAATSVRQARAAAARDGDWASLRDLAVAGGGVLIMARQPGALPTALPADVGDDVTAAFARAVARLHQRRLAPSSARSAPRLGTGSSVAGLAGTARDLLDALRPACATAAALTVLTQLRRAVRTATRHAENRHPGARVRTLCHGDLRFHNGLVDDDGAVHLIDFEHAGIGDPMVDLALMTVRTPLSPHQELVLLDAYGTAMAPQRRGWLERYFAVKPLCAVIGAVAGLLDLRDVAMGLRPVGDDGAAWVDRRRGACVAELIDALPGRLAPELVDHVVTALTTVAASPATTTTTMTTTTATTTTTTTTTVRSKRPSKKQPWVAAVAIDGTAASGKSVVAAVVAARLGLPHFNTGLAFRAAALVALEHGVAADDDDLGAFVRRLRRLRVSLTDDGGIVVGGRRLDEALGVFEVDEVVSSLAAVPAVHGAVTAWLMPVLGARLGVCEGRDITTAWWPQVPHRFFLTAAVDERARRTAARLGRPISVARVASLVKRRDAIDTKRTINPMVKGDGVVVVDTTRCSEDDAVARVLEHIRGAS